MPGRPVDQGSVLARPPRAFLPPRRCCAARPRLPGGSAPPSPSPQRPPGPSRSAPRPALVACCAGSWSRRSRSRPLSPFQRQPGCTQPAGSPFNAAQRERVPERLMISRSPTIAVALAPLATGRRPVGGAFAPVADLSLGIWGSIGSGVCGFTHDLSGAWQARNWDHVWEKRCSGLDPLGCDPGPGYAARGGNTRGTELAYCSLRLRADVRAAPASSLEWVYPIAPPPLHRLRSTGPDSSGG